MLTNYISGKDAEALPQVLVENILLLLPLEFVLRFRLVCSDIGEISSQKSFIYMHLNKSEPRVLLIDCNAPMVRVANVKSLFAMYLEIPTSVGVKRFSGGGVILCDRLLLSWTTVSLKGIHVWNPCS